MNIYQSINGIMEEISPITKEKKTSGSESFAFKYRGVDQVMNALQPLLSKYKVFVVPKVLEQARERVVTTKNNQEKQTQYSILNIEFTFYAEDGTSVSAITVGEGMDSGDKASNKAMSIAFKYACFQVFCIPTEDVIDPDAETHNTVAAKVEPRQEPTQEQAEPREKTKCVCQACQTEMDSAKFSKCVKKYGVGVCSGECLKNLGIRARE